MLFITKKKKKTRGSRKKGQAFLVKQGIQPCDDALNNTASSTALPWYVKEIKEH